MRSGVPDYAFLSTKHDVVLTTARAQAGDPALVPLPTAHCAAPELKRASAVAAALNKLKPADRQAVLNEAGARCTAGGIRKPAAYLMSLIQRALKGNFHPWAGQAEPSPIAEPPAPAPSRPSRQQGDPASALAQACLNELRQLRGKRGGHQ